MRTLWAIFYGVAFLGSTGCTATIPSESVELSITIGDMILAAKVSHVNMVNTHFDHLRTEVDNFAMMEYKESFLTNIRKLMKEKNPAFTELTFSEYDRAIMRVLKKRSEWMESVEKNRQQVLQALEEHYMILLASNAEMTSMVRSAAKLSETQAALMQRFGSKVGISGTKMKEVEDKLLESSTSIRSLMDTAAKQIGE